MIEQGRVLFAGPAGELFASDALLVETGLARSVWERCGDAVFSGMLNFDCY